MAKLLRQNVGRRLLSLCSNLGSVPIGALAFVLVLVVIPNGFPYHEQHRRGLESPTATATSMFSRMDFLGSVLLIAAALSLTAGFQEADTHFPWRSAYVITLLSLSGLLWIMLLLWERHLSRVSTVCEPVMPWQFATNRVVIGILL